jgi:hypothetical protein
MPPSLTYANVDTYPKLYRRFKSAVPQFIELKADLKSAELVLNAVGEFCQAEESNGHKLSPPEQADLRTLVDNCKGTLSELKRMLDANPKLGSHNPSIISRLKWSHDSVENSRRRLQFNLVNLSTYTTPMMYAFSQGYVYLG